MENYKMNRKNINKVLLIPFTLLVFIFHGCVSDNQIKIFDIGDRIPQSNIIQDDTINFCDNISRMIKTSSDTNRSFFINEKNEIFFYIEENIDKNRFNEYLQYFSKKYPNRMKIIDSSLSSYNFICKKYIWEDSISADFVILSSCKNIKDTISILGEKWNLEVGNDSLIEMYRKNNY